MASLTNKNDTTSSNSHGTASVVVGQQQQRGLVIVFLDIDGVLLPFGQCSSHNSNKTTASPLSCVEGCLFPAANLEALSMVLEEIPEIRIVLSSTWRVQVKFRQDILKSFRLYGYALGGPLLDVSTAGFYDVTDCDLHSERQHEIYAWLNQLYDDDEEEEKTARNKRPPIAAWIALDDEDLIYGDANRQWRHVFEGHVVQTVSHKGLTLDDAKMAIQLLRQQLQPKTAPPGTETGD